jgi:hypothetical protein
MSAIFDLITAEKTVEVLVDGKTFYLKILSGFERDVFESQWLSFKQEDSVIGIRAFMVAFCLSDVEGVKTFDSGEGSEATEEFLDCVKQVGDIPAGKLQPLFNAAMEKNGFSDEEVTELEKK